jgi:hypothetical protein
MNICYACLNINLKIRTLLKSFEFHELSKLGVYSRVYGLPSAAGGLAFPAYPATTNNVAM